MTRHRDWQSRLQACLAERCPQEFEWGKQDCCLFVCDCVLAMTGRDPAADLRGYVDELGAARIVKKNGGIRAIATARLGAEIAPLLASVGDVGLVETAGRESLALCAGGHWLAPGPYDVECLPLEAAITAWRCE